MCWLSTKITPENKSAEIREISLWKYGHWTECPNDNPSAHMDTISSTADVRPIVHEGKIRSDGTTILGLTIGSASLLFAKSFRRSSREMNGLAILKSFFRVWRDRLEGSNTSISPSCTARVLCARQRQYEVGTVINKARRHSDLSVIYWEKPLMRYQSEDGINAIAIAAKGLAQIPQGKLNTTLHLISAYIGGKRSISSLIK